MQRDVRGTMRMTVIAGCFAAGLALLTACGGGGNGGGTVSGSGGVPSSGGSVGATGGAGAAGASAGGATGSGGTGGMTPHPCLAPGEPLASGACYVPCTYAPGSPPRYEDANGACTKIGWKCTPFQYCNPNIHCMVDATCQSLGGPGWICVPTPTGPLVGQCALSCQTAADCPDSKGATPSPYVCSAVDNGTTAVNICRF